VPYFVERAGGASRTVAIVGMLLLGATMSIGRLTFGFVVERIGSARYFLIAGLLCAVSLMLTALPLGPFFSITCLIVAGLALAGNFPAILGGAADRFPDAGASMFAVLTMVAVIGAIIGPLSVGLVADRLGLRLAMASQALAPVSLIVLMAWFRRSGA
jgi:fucose permease